MSLILLSFARPQCLAATHLLSPEVGNGLNWPKPQCTCNVMVTSQAQHSTNEGVLRSNSACSMLMSDDLRLPRRGIEPRPFGFREVGSTARPLPLPLLRAKTESKCKEESRIRDEAQEKSECGIVSPSFLLLDLRWVIFFFFDIILNLKIHHLMTSCTPECV